MATYRNYKIKYFDRFGTQNQLFNTNLDDAFFREWFARLINGPEDNWHISASTCIRLLVEHPDAPEWLRDIYAKNSRYDRRMTAFLTRSGNYKYKHIDKILSDRSYTVRNSFLYTVAYDLQKGVSIEPEFLSQILRHSASMRTQLRYVIKEQTVSLIDKDPIIRTLAKIFHTATSEQKQLLLNSIK